MKWVIAVIHPFKVNDIQDALAHQGISQLVITEVNSFIGHSPVTWSIPGAEYVSDLIAKVQIEVMVEDELCDEVVASIVKAADTGLKNDTRLLITSSAR